MPTMQEVAAEAICSALYNMPYVTFLGERPDDFGSDVAYFRLAASPAGTNARKDPKQVVVAIRKAEAGLVVIQVTWYNISRGLDHPLRGEKILRVGSNAPLHDVQLATEQAVLAILDIYTDVLGGTGVAGPIEDLAPPSEAGDPDDPDDMAVPLPE
jgi:hypothetical protein